MTTKGKTFRSEWKHQGKPRTDQEVTISGVFIGTGGRKTKKGSRRATRH